MTVHQVKITMVLFTSLLIFCLLFREGATEANPEIAKIKTKLNLLTNQVTMMQMAIEEKQRSDGDSGIKQVRHNTGGSKSYYPQHHSGSSVAAIHNHDNNIRTLGLGEIIAILNGVEFRTRHNDFRMYMPHRTSTGLHEVENITFPDVPPEVLNKPTVDAQIAEMREWFKAWKNQDYSVRDYRKYFKPVLCYLEGAWTHSKASIEEPFHSDRHTIDAKSWEDLMRKITFTTATGTKSILENFAYLPTSIVGKTNESIPIIAQWNYRILCQPLKDDLPLNRFRLVEDLKTRVSRRYTNDELALSRNARFRLNPFDTKSQTKEGFIKYGLLDKLMYQIPGKDNAPANITDDAFGVVAYDMSPSADGAKLNAGYYHRWVRIQGKDAMGGDKRKSGFADDNLFVALSTQERIVERKVEWCKNKGTAQYCGEWAQRPSYAIPTEIIFMTPLNKWNPYNIVHKDRPSSPEGKTVSAGERNGEKTLDKAYNGTHDTLYYRTPDAFFSGGDVDPDLADTSKTSLGFLNKSGDLVVVRASGFRIVLPNIEGVGMLRQRFPIMPVHGEGNGMAKEMQALRDVVLYPRTNGQFLQEDRVSPVASNDSTITTTLLVGTSLAENVTPHTHSIGLTAEEDSMIKGYQSVVKTSSRAIGHDHDIVILRTNNAFYYIYDCDQRGGGCFDKHPREMTSSDAPVA